MIDPAEPWYDGSALPLALSLYREAVYWALVAQGEASEPQTLRELVTAASFESSGLNATEVALVKHALVEETFVESAETPLETLREQTIAARTFVLGLIRDELAGERRLNQLLLQRLLRVGVVVLALVAGGLATYSGIRRLIRGPDLAEGKSWRTSSQEYECKPADRTCGGVTTSILFHTFDQDQPWVVYDLESPRRVARVEVVNRDDCCTERAVPLVVETSEDGEQFREVARATEPFSDWETTFTRVKARYVRLRVDRRSILHLTRVSIFAK